MKIRLFRTSRVAVGVAALALAAMSVPNAGAVTSTTPPATALDTSGAPYWQGWDIVRGVALTHAATPGGKIGGYVVDAWGGIHPFGGAPAKNPSHYHPGSATIHGIALQGDDAYGDTINASATPFAFPKGALLRDPSTGCDNTAQFGVPIHGISFDPTPVNGTQYNLNGAVVDAWGGIHVFCTPSQGYTLNTSGAPYWPNWQIVNGLAVLPGGTGGFTLDGYGAVHAWGNAHLATPPDSYWGPRAGVKAWNIARGVAIDGTATSGTGQQGNGVVVDGWGGMHPFTYTVG